MVTKQLYLLLATCIIIQVQGIMFYLEPNAQKCLKEELHAHILVSGEYDVTEVAGQKIDYVVSIVIEFINRFF